MAWSIFREGGGDTAAVAWAKQLLQMIGAPVTPGNTEFIYQWEKSEGGGGAYNPLNQGYVPGRPDLTTTGSQYGGGANDYASWQAGLIGAAHYLDTEPTNQYLAVGNALRANNPAAARQALWASPWAASHYGYGANWANVPLPGNASTITPLDPTTAGGSSATPASDPCSMYSGAMKTLCQKSYGLTPASPGTGSDACVWSLFGQCFLSKTNVRAVIGGLLIGAGGVVIIAGTIMLLRFGVERTGAAEKLSQIPGTTRIANRLS